MGQLVTDAEKLPSIHDSDAWEGAVEALLLNLAKAVESGVMLQADYTRKTQALSEERRLVRSEFG